MLDADMYALLYDCEELARAVGSLCRVVHAGDGDRETYAIVAQDVRHALTAARGAAARAAMLRANLY